MAKTEVCTMVCVCVVKLAAYGLVELLHERSLPCNTMHLFFSFLGRRTKLWGRRARQQHTQ